MIYNIVKSLHIISIVAWMAGLLYLPRLFVYHSQLPLGSGARATFETMERRLLKAIMLPAMLVSWAFGVWLATLLGAWSQGWLHAKLTLVVLLSGLHGEAPGERGCGPIDAVLSRDQRGSDRDPRPGGVPGGAEALLDRLRRRLFIEMPISLIQGVISSGRWNCLLGRPWVGPYPVRPPYRKKKSFLLVQGSQRGYVAGARSVLRSRFSSTDGVRRPRAASACRLLNSYTCDLPGFQPRLRHRDEASKV